MTVETAPPSAELDIVGERYRLLQRLVALTAATPGVWRGQDTVLNRQVTVIVHEPAGAVANALLEHAHALSMIEHPALPRVFDAEDEGSRTWVVTEWVEGSTLAGLLAESPFDAQQAASTVAGLAEGVALAHRAGLAVGLLDPDHVVVTPRGTVTVTRLLVGDGSPADDVRHLGALLYAMLTGVWPLTGHRDGVPPTPRQVRAGVPAELSEVAMRALSPGHPNRLSTAPAVADALSRWHRAMEPEPFVADLPADERYPDKPRRPRRPRRTGPVIAFVAAFCAIALAGVLINNLRTHPGNPAAQTPTTTAAPTSSTAVRPALTTLHVSGVTLFDPQGDGNENPNHIQAATDNNPATTWSTVDYRRSAKFGNLKNGVGLIFDLGQQAQVREVRIRTTLPGADLDIRTGTSDGTGATVDAFPVVAQTSLGRQDNVITLRPGINSRYYLVWFTQLVSVGANSFAADLADVQFLG